MKKMQPLAYGIITLAALLYLFDAAITVNPFYFEGAFFWCVLITAYFGVWALFRFGSLIPQVLPNGVRTFDFQLREKFPKWAKLVLIVPWAFLVVMMVGSSVFFNVKAYRDQLGNAEVRTFSTDLQVVDVGQIPVVDQFLAKKLADKKLGERPSLGSQVHLGEPTIQRVNGKLQWVVPLHHSGLFKWLTNMEGTPGYVVVSATNVNDVEYVEGYKIKYHPDSYLLHDLSRHIRLNGGLFSGIVDDSFELDENGQPYWIVTSYKNTRGFALPEANGIFAVNATTGETTFYDMENIPEWVDRVQPEAFIKMQINNQGEYVHGFLNFSDKDKFKTSRGEAIIYNNGRCYLFTGLTSVGQDESAIGFIMVDMVTKQPYLYQMNGATESAAQSSAQGKVQHLGYKASFPIILNIDGQPTYFMTLKDQEGLVKQYAMVSVTNYSNVGVGETINMAMKDYENVLRNDNSSNVTINTGERLTYVGDVVRIANEFNGTDTVYKLILKGKEEVIFVATSSTSEELALTQVGDTVSVTYYNSGNPTEDLVGFDNLLFNQQLGGVVPPVEPPASHTEGETQPAGDETQPEDSTALPPATEGQETPAL